MMSTSPIAPSLESRWYAVQARPKQETRAAMNLLSSGLTTFLPLIRQGKQPLFPRYLFVRCDIAQFVQRIRYTRGVVKVLGTSDGPIALDDAIIESIQQRIGDDGFVHLTDFLEPGDAVEITDGPLKGLVGIFHAATPAAERVILLLNAMNSQMRVMVDASAINRCPA